MLGKPVDHATPMIDEEVLSPPPLDGVEPRARNMFFPIAAMVLFMPLGLYITGSSAVAGAGEDLTLQGILSEGSGSTSVLWSVMFGLGVSWVMLLGQRIFSVEQLVKIGLRGAGALVPLALILLLALALGDVIQILGTGEYVAGVTAGTMPNFVYLPLVFLVSGGIAFSTGTSWGTFAIMLPIAVPAAATLGLPLAPYVYRWPANTAGRRGKNRVRRSKIRGEAGTPKASKRCSEDRKADHGDPTPEKRVRQLGPNVIDVVRSRSHRRYDRGVGDR